MRRQSTFLFLMIGALCLSFSSLQAAKTKYFRSQEDADNYLTMRYNLGCKYYNDQEWRHAANEFEKVICIFPSSDAAADAAYYLAVCYFEMKEYDFANREFSNYLKASQHPAFFEDAVYYKFCIAEHFKTGKKRRPFEMRYLPKWISAEDLALTIYDEVIAALPTHELTICALYSKAELLRRMGEYRDSVEAYQMIIRRFPGNEMIPVCYLKIAETYKQQSRYEFQNPDILALAELNLRKFNEDFPRDERVAVAEESVSYIKEMYAKGLCDLGLFYERMKKPEAAAIYFQSSIEEFPDTHVAQFCRSRLICLGYNKDELAPCEVSSPSLDEGSDTVLQEQEEAQEPFMEEPSSISDEMPPLYGNMLSMNQENVFDGEIPSQDYTHYSLMKERDVKTRTSHVSYEQATENEEIEGELPQFPSDVPSSAEEAPFLMHYSQIKHRDQKYVAPKD